jgi:hypothetical protein
MKDLLHWFQTLPAVGGNGQGFTSKEIPTVENESTPDYQLWWNHLCVGVVEIKCFTKTHDQWMIDRPKLEMLYKNHQSKGIPALLCFAHVVDGLPSLIEVVDLRDLIANKDQWQEAPEEWMKKRREGLGDREKPFKGYLLPRTLFWSVL